MRKIFLLNVALLLAVLTASAQNDRLFSVGGGLGGSSVSAGDDDGWGVSYYANAFVTVKGKWSAGLEYNGNSAVIGDISGVDFEATKINAILGKARYKFGTKMAGVYGAIGLGTYTIKPGEISNDSGDISTPDSKTNFGFAPEVGAYLTMWQLAVSYHFAGSADVYADDGASQEVDYNMLQVTLGINIGF